MTYTAVKNLFRKRTGFSSVRCNDDLFVVEARHGAWLSTLGDYISNEVNKLTQPGEIPINAVRYAHGGI
jgi:hypothetical protein